MVPCAFLHLVCNTPPTAFNRLHRANVLPALVRRLPLCEFKKRQYRLMPPVLMGRRSSKIAMRKGKTDAIKAKLWGKYGKMIVQTAKAGGANPESNVRLGEVRTSLA